MRLKTTADERNTLRRFYDDRHDVTALLDDIDTLLEALREARVHVGANVHDSCLDSSGPCQIDPDGIGGEICEHERLTLERTGALLAP